jgi:hypothetical protein
MVAAATIGSAVIGGGVAANSARKSRNAQENATAENNKLSESQMAEDKRRYDLDREDRNMWASATMEGEQAQADRIRQDSLDAYGRVRSDNTGAMNRGELAGNQLAYRLGLGGTGTGEAGGLNSRYKDFNYNFEADPGYQFRMSEGQNGVNNKMAASGSLLSGAALKALTRFNQDYASNEYGNSYNRARSGYESDRNAFSADNTNEYNRLMGVQGAGQNAVNSTASAGMGANSTNASAGMNAQNQISNAYQGLATGAANASAQYGQQSNNYYNNLMGNNNANANAQSAYNTAFGNAIGGGLGMATGAWNSYQRQGQSQPYVYDNGYSMGTGSAYGGSRRGM